MQLPKRVYRATNRRELSIYDDIDRLEKLSKLRLQPIALFPAAAGGSVCWIELLQPTRASGGCHEQFHPPALLVWAGFGWFWA
jgi:hypothetical protein